MQCGGQCTVYNTTNKGLKEKQKTVRIIKISLISIARNAPSI